MRTSHFAFALTLACFSTVDAISLQQEQDMDANWLVQTEDISRRDCKADTDAWVKKTGIEDNGYHGQVSAKLSNVQLAWEDAHPDLERNDIYDDKKQQALEMKILKSAGDMLESH